MPRLYLVYSFIVFEVMRRWLLLVGSVGGAACAWLRIDSRITVLSRCRVLPRAIRPRVRVVRRHGRLRRAEELDTGCRFLESEGDGSGTVVIEVA